jgi:hypothetical protein
LCLAREKYERLARDDAWFGDAVKADIVERAAKKLHKDCTVRSDRNGAELLGKLNALTWVKVLKWLCHSFAVPHDERAKGHNPKYVWLEDSTPDTGMSIQNRCEMGAKTLLDCSRNVLRHDQLCYGDAGASLVRCVWILCMNQAAYDAVLVSNEGEMSYSSMTAAQPEQRSRPVGVAIIAIFGMLLGFSNAVYDIGWCFYNITNGVPIVPMLIGTAIGLAVDWGIVYLYMGLWDLMRWAWVVHIALSAGIAFGAYSLHKNLLSALKELTPLLKAQYVKPVSEALPIVTMGILVISILVVLYLLVVHRAFKIGVSDQRPLWDR